jgi:hypothetical protein
LWETVGKVLPANQRTIAYLCFVDGLGQAEIAEAVGLSQPQVSRTLTEIRRILRTHLEPYRDRPPRRFRGHRCLGAREVAAARRGKPQAG